VEDDIRELSVLVEVLRNLTFLAKQHAGQPETVRQLMDLAEENIDRYVRHRMGRVAAAHSEGAAN
jgi:hypothetical protein